MTQDEIIEMAKQAASKKPFHEFFPKLNIDVLEAFANLVAQHEREACAKVADEYTKASYLGAVGAAIRARGNHE